MPHPTLTLALGSALVAVATVGAGSSRSDAPGKPVCSCAVLPTLQDEFNQVSDVFAGRVLTVRDTVMRHAGQGPSIPAELFAFVVKQRWKGASVDTVQVWRDTLCEWEMKVGNDYVVFARPNAGLLYTSWCARTASYWRSREVLRWLGPPRR
jgi:hypothetical protein